MTERVLKDTTEYPVVNKRAIQVRGARVNSLKNISIDIPRNTLTVITGVSGSGKSSLAFDTIYAEGQRRFVESLSAYARQFLERMSKPDVDSITGLPPAIAIEQKTVARNPRSTVGTSTEVYDFLRLLFGRIGITHCFKCGQVVRKDTPQIVLDEIIQWPEGQKLYVLFPLPESSLKVNEELQRLREAGFFRVVLKDSTEIIEVTEDTVLKGVSPEEVFVLVDRLVVRTDDETRSRIIDSLESAFSAGDGKIVIQNLSTGNNWHFSSRYECARDGIVYQEPEPRLFSFNSPFGACPTCQGFGRSVGIDIDLVIPDRSKTLNNGAIHPWRTPAHSRYIKPLLKIAKKYDIPLDTPIHLFSKAQFDILLNGVEDFIGINGYFAEIESQTYKMHYRVLLSRYRGYTKCHACHGARLRTSARQVFVGGKTIQNVVEMTLEEALYFFTNLQLNETQIAIAGQIMAEILWRMELLVEIGLGYLTLDRLSHTLSGGESQRINLATSLGSALVGTLYVLDEPSIGLHPRDTDRLIKILHKLRNLGNTVVVVEHDADIMQNADVIIDMGPMAGEHGGEVIFAGTHSEILKSENSLTGQYLSGRKTIDVPIKRGKGNGKILKIVKPLEHNLKGDDTEIPLGCMTVVTGVSGSGKSTLIHDVLFAHLQKHKGLVFNGRVGICERIEGMDNVGSVEMIDQSPIGKSSRSTPVTYTKAFDAIREVFASTQAAKQLGWKPGHFSFNVPGGRCDTCEGEGDVTIEMQFLPDIHLECEVCGGTRYKKEARHIHFKDKSIVDVLNMTVNEAVEFFKETPKVKNKIKILQDVGLGYIKLGQPSSLLSGGEAQRVKLATYLDTEASEPTLFIFDEPTTGLHMDDVATLLKAFKKLVENGHSIIIIEHNLHVMASADWIIDMGPDGGDKGGRLVASGTPEDIASNSASYTGQFLKPVLAELFKKKK
jgi:excinuclease ABC subunit A